MTVAALGAFGLGGAAIAGAAGNKTSTTKSSSTAKKATRSGGDSLSAADAAKVKAAALDKVPGATVLETEAGGPYGTPYHAHIKTADGTLQVVLVDANFKATTVQADNGRGGKGRDGDHGGPGHRGGGGRGNETPLTGDTKSSVEAAVLDKYPGATIQRTESNSGDANAPYESHITTTDGKDLEVTVSKDFKVVDANAHP
jgi:uncharacterized membrane protein YkoI